MPLPSDNDLTFRTDDETRWGTGKGAALSKAEVDLNFWYLLTLIADLQSNSAQPLEIESIDVEGGQMTITLSDGVTTFGPFDLPQQAFRWRGAYTSGAEYKKFDVFTASEGAYLVLQDHTAPSTFDPSATTVDGAVYQLMFPYQNIYDISFFCPGKPGTGLEDGDAMFAIKFARDVFLLADLPNAQLEFQVNPTDFWSVELYKNGDFIGNIDYDPEASEPGFIIAFESDVQFEAGDVLTVTRPLGDSANDLDATAKGFMMTLAARKGTLP